MDGSQLSFKLSGDHLMFRNRQGFLEFSSIYLNALIALQNLVNLVNPNYVYHGEAICKLRHNQLLYKRTPKMFFVLFEVEDVRDGSFLNYENKEKEAKRLGIEVTPLLFRGNGPNDEKEISILLLKMEDGRIESILGGKPEGIVVKTYTGNKWPKLLKLVRDEFKEQQAATKDYGTKIKSVDELCEVLGKQYAVTARFHKAVQHLKESKTGLSNSKKDIGLLVKELDKDLMKEYKSDLSAALLGYFFTVIAGHARTGLTTWYGDMIEKDKDEEIQINDDGSKEHGAD